MQKLKSNLKRNLKFSKFKIKYKIILSMYLVIIPILLIVSSNMYIENYEETVDEMTNVYENLTRTIENNIDYLQADLLDLSTYITINSDIRYILNAKDKKSFENQPLIWELSAPTDFVEDMISIKSHIKTIILYPENGIQPFYISQDNSVYNRNLGDIRNLEVYKAAVEAKGDQVWTRINKYDEGIYIQNNSDKIVISREIYDWSKKRKIGFLSMGVDATKYEEICNNALSGQNEGILIYTPSGDELIRVGEIDELVVGFLRQNIVQNQKDQDIQEHLEYENYYIFYRKTDYHNNFICYILPKSNWDSRIFNVIILSVAFGVALLLALYPLSMLASTIISKPLNNLYHSMVKFKEGDFEQQVKVTGNDEIGEVALCFNQMVKDIKELIDKNYVMVLRERQSELDALQAQINPHFLYNALDSLYWQALNANSDKLAEDIMSLSQLFRLVLSQGQSMIPIAREKELIYHYLQIQKMRFEKKLSFIIDMEEQILDYKIPKLIIQPFVENAIVHGLERTGEKGMIEVKGYLKEAHIVIEVKDNGVGMTEEQVNGVFEENDSKEYTSQRIGKYAIKNINERLSLKYHDDFILQIQSKVGFGTTVIITLPASKE